MPVTVPNYSTGLSTTTNLDTGTYSVTQVADGFGISKYDYIALTYVASGNGTGEIQTATYKTGGASGITVASLTITYDANNRISTVTRTA